jgi:hypothetical protein
MNVFAHPKEGRAILGAQSDMITKAIQKIFRNPSHAADTSSFFYGDYKPLSVTGLVDAQPVVDL